MNRLITVTGLFLLIILFSNCSKSHPPSQKRIFPVIIADVEQRDIPIFVNIIGNVHSLQVVQIRPQVGGIVKEAYVTQGQYVKKGDPLFKIDPRLYQANLEKAKAALMKDQAALNLAEITVARNASLVQKDYVSKLTNEQYITNVSSAKGQILNDQADIALAELNLEWTTPKSPIDGKISQFNVDPGNVVVANDPNAITDIRQITPADIRFFIPQKYFLEAQKAFQKGTLKFEATLPQVPDKPREGEIYFLDNHIDLTTGTILVKGTVPNEDEFFWPGEFIDVKLIMRTQAKALLVPEEAISYGLKGPFVYVYDVKTKTVEYRDVVKGEKIDKLIQIEKGIHLGEKVVIRGQINLRPGVEVSVDKHPNQ